MAKYKLKDKTIVVKEDVIKQQFNQLQPTQVLPFPKF